MSQYATLKAAIAAAIKQNGNNSITGNLLQQQLLAMVDSLGTGYQFMGVATQTTNPGTPDQNVFYISSEPGAYSNFGFTIEPGEFAILAYNGSWSKKVFSNVGQNVEYNSMAIFGQLIETDSVIANSYVGTNGTIVGGFTMYRVRYFVVDATKKVCVYGKSKGSGVVVISKWNSSKTALTQTILVSQQNNVLKHITKIVTLSANECLCITELVDYPVNVRVYDGMEQNIEDIQFNVDNMFAASVTPGIIDGKYISNSNTLVSFASFYIKTYQLKAGNLYKVHIRYASGGYQDVAALYSGSVADENFKKWLIRNPADSVLHTYDFLFIAESDNDILAITQYTTPTVESAFCFVQEIELKDGLSDIANLIGPLDITVYGNKITLDSTISDSFIENRSTGNPVIRSGFPTYRILYYTVDERTDLAIWGKIKGGGVVTVSVWNSDKTTCLSKEYISTQNDYLLPFKVFATIEPDQYLAITELIPNDIEVRKTDGLVTDVFDLENDIIPSIVLENAAASVEAQTAPDFATLNGKTWNAVGDSITAENKYTVGVSSRLGLSYRNCGLASSTIAINNTYLQNQSIVERVLGLNGNTPYSDADIWTIFGGTNDILYNTPLGNLGEFDNTTFYGALSNICAYIRSRPNNPKLILITPYQLKTLDGAYQKEMTKAILRVAKMYACPVIDLYNEGGICHTNINNVLRDGVHPVDPVGNSILISAIASGIFRNC